MKKIVKFLPCILSLCLMAACKPELSFDSETVIAELSTAFVEVEKDDYTALENVLTQYKHGDPIDKDTAVNSYVQTELQKHEFYKVVDLLVILKKHYFDLSISSTDIENLLIEKFSQISSNIDEDKLKDALRALEGIYIKSPTLRTAVEDAYKNNLDFSQKVQKEMVFLPGSTYYRYIDFLSSDEIQNYVTENAEEVSISQKTGGYYSSEEDYYSGPGLLLESWHKITYYGDFCVTLDSKEQLDYYYQREVVQTQTVYFRGKQISSEKDTFRADSGKAYFDLNFTYIDNAYYDGEYLFFYEGNDKWIIDRA